MEVGRTIRVIMAKKKISMTKLAGEIKISRQALYERLDGDMTVSSLVEILDKLGVELGYIEDGKVRKFL